MVSIICHLEIVYAAISAKSGDSSGLIRAGSSTVIAIPAFIEISRTVFR